MARAQVNTRAYVTRHSCGSGYDVVVVIHGEQVIAIHERGETHQLLDYIANAWLALPLEGNDEWVLV